MRKSSKFYNQQPQINILPMIDIIFVILSFFIISSLYLVKLESIPLNLPNAETSKNELNDPIIVSLDKSGNIYINKNYATKESFERDISKFAENKKLILIRADEDIKYGEVVYILDTLRKFNNFKIAVSTEPK